MARWLTALALVAALLVPACGERVRWEDTIVVPVGLRGSRIVPALEEALGPELMAELGGGIPEQWPDHVPHATRDVAVEIPVTVNHAALGEVGADLGSVAAGEGELRVRDIAIDHEPGDLSHALAGGTLWVAPEGTVTSDHEDARRVGLIDLEEGRILFQPGGRAALAEALAEPRSVLVLQLMVLFDSRTSPVRPTGEASLELRLQVDVLR